MSSNSSNTDDSHNYSDINFICGYVIVVKDDANMSSTDAFINKHEWFFKPYQDKPMVNVKWIAKYNEQRWLEEDKLQMQQIHLEGYNKVESRVSLTACVIIYYCLPTSGVFSKFVSCACIYGFNCINCSTQGFENAKKVSVAWRSMLMLRQLTGIKFSSRSNLYQQAASQWQTNCFFVFVAIKDIMVL